MRKIHLYRKKPRGIVSLTLVTPSLVAFLQTRHNICTFLNHNSNQEEPLRRGGHPRAVHASTLSHPITATAAPNNKGKGLSVSRECRLTS
jgi:hypothetical protein